MNKIIVFGFIFLSLFAFGQQKTMTLEDCIQYAIDNDLTLKENKLNQEISQNEITASYGKLMPAGALYADHQYNFGSVIDPTTNARISSDIRSNSFGFSANVELFNWGNFIQIKSAKLKKDKSKYDFEVKKNELIIKIVQSFQQIQYDKEQIELIEKQLANTEIMLNRIETEFNLGNKAKSDVYEMLANKAVEEQMLVLAQNAFKTSNIKLLNLLNLEGMIEFIGQTDFLLLSLTDSLTNLYQEGLQNRPEIKSAEIQTKISEKNIQIQKSNYLPRISGNYSLSTFYVDIETASFRDQLRNNKNHYLGLSLNIPVFNRLQTRTAVQNAKIESEQINLQLEQQKQAYFNALREAMNFAQNAAQNHDAAQKNVAAQEISFSKTEEKFKLGMIDAYAYFAAKNSLLAAQSELLQAKFNCNYQLILLKYYLTNEVL